MTMDTFASLKTYDILFREAAPLRVDNFHGRFKAIFIGPTWFKKCFEWLLVMVGLGGWQGKEFSANGTGHNLCNQNNQIIKKSSMYIKGVFASRIDKKPTLVLGYHDNSILHYISDEIRLVDQETILGMSYLDFPLLRIIKIPFALRQSNTN